MKITSLKNEQVKYWVKLSEKKFRDEERIFLIEGDHLIKEAYKYGEVLYTIGIDEDNDYVVTPEVMKKISKQVTYPQRIAALKYLTPREVRGNALILDGVQDPGNLGTIIRSALAFNFDTIVLSNTCVDIYNPKVIRATEGMIFKVNVLRKDLEEYLPKLKNDCYSIIGTDVKSGTSLKEIPKTKLGVVIGSEGQGISMEVRKLCDNFIHIPMNKDVESLNAAVSASIIMYEVANG